LEDARESGKGVERLESGISRIAQPLVTEAQIQRETRGHLPVILNKPVNPVLIAGKGAGSRTPQGAIETVRNSVVNQRLQAGVVPLSTGAWQEVSRSDPVPPLCAEFEHVRSPNDRDVVEELIIVLRVALLGIVCCGGLSLLDPGWVACITATIELLGEDTGARETKTAPSVLTASSGVTAQPLEPLFRSDLLARSI